MTKEDLILSSLSKIQEDTSQIRENIAALKTKDDEHYRKIEKLEGKVDKMASDIVSLKTKAAIGGAIAGSFLGLLVGVFMKLIDWVGNIFHS